jgi:DNA end-binding protein Ku
MGKRFMGTTLRYPYELRDSKDYFDDIPDVNLPAEMLKLAEHILESKAADFEPSMFFDRYEQAVVAMLKKKQSGMPMPKEKPSTPPANVVNLMDALRKSIEASGQPAKPKKRVDGQREMLLPIAGRGQKEKTAARPAKQRKTS